MLVDFDELNALAATFDDYPTPEDILKKTDIAGENESAPKVAAAAIKPFRMLKRTPETSDDNGYTYSKPDNPIQLPSESANSTTTVVPPRNTTEVEQQQEKI